MPIRSVMRQGLKRAVITGGLEFAHLAERVGLMASARGMGAIFTLHHVRPKTPQSFDPNAHLEITPEFLDAAIGHLTEEGYQFVALADMPARLAIATTCTIALVEPPSAMWTLIALWKAAGVRIFAGVRSSHTMSTIRRPAPEHIRGWLESAAGIDDAPGNARPIASAIDIMVAAVPITMQVPNERAMPPSISFQSSSVMFPARFSSQYFQTSEPEPSFWPRQLPRSIGPAGM